MKLGRLHEFYASHRRIRCIDIYLPSFPSSPDAQLKGKFRLLCQDMLGIQVLIQYLRSITNLSSQFDSSGWRHGDRTLGKVSHTCGRWSKHKIDNVFSYRDPSENEARATT